MAVIGYIFVGDDETDFLDGDRQRQDIVKYGAGLGLHPDRFCIERGCSLRRPFAQRQQGGRLLEEIEADDVIIACRAEWVLGSAKEGLHLLNLLERRHISLYCADFEENLSLPGERRLIVYEGGASLVKKLLRALAACESTTHGESIRAAKKQMKKQGKYLGGPIPFGWKVEGSVLVKDREQQKIIRQIRKMRDDRWSYRDISQKLKDDFGIQLSHEGIRKMLLHDQRNT